MHSASRCRPGSCLPKRCHVALPTAIAPYSPLSIRRTGPSRRRSQLGSYGCLPLIWKRIPTADQPCSGDAPNGALVTRKPERAVRPHRNFIECGSGSNVNRVLGDDSGRGVVIWQHLWSVETSLAPIPRILCWWWFVTALLLSITRFALLRI